MFGRTSGRGCRVAAMVVVCGGAVALASGWATAGARPVLPGAEEVRVALPGMPAARMLVDDPGGDADDGDAGRRGRSGLPAGEPRGG
ncbi:MAG: hypothetical protein R3B49_04155 [Phycisphaerales bacterium]